MTVCLGLIPIRRDGCTTQPTSATMCSRLYRPTSFTMRMRNPVHLPRLTRLASRVPPWAFRPDDLTSCHGALKHTASYRMKWYVAMSYHSYWSAAAKRQAFAARARKASISPDTNCSKCSETFSMGQSHHTTSLSLAITSGSKRCLMGLAGLPPTMVYGGASGTTTEREDPTTPLLMPGRRPGCRYRPVPDHDDSPLREGAAECCQRLPTRPLIVDIVREAICLASLREQFVEQTLGFHEAMLGQDHDFLGRFFRSSFAVKMIRMHQWNI